ncbi:MAG: hypothetical protein DMD39_04815 [Gemmatimonadetes bacterium]|nr:MAG: hypothetical protein DMD39_04815 [Gemmatimonadota bacterium]
MMEKTLMKRLLIAATLMLASAASAQTPKDPSARLRQVLPAKVADHVLATIADARSHSLPAKALEQQALRLANKGTKPAEVEKSIDESAENMKKAKAALENGGRKPTSDEVVAGSQLIGRGVDGSKVSDFAKTAPHDRSLAVPLFVTGSLMNRGLKSDAALARVHARLMQKATDRQLTAEANATASEKRPETANKEGGLAHRPVTPGVSNRPVTPPGPPAAAGRKR